MLFNLLSFIISNMGFMGSYSNDVFPPPLSDKEEEEYIFKMNNGDKEARNNSLGGEVIAYVW